MTSIQQRFWQPESCGFNFVAGPKSGIKTVGVARQCCGRTGKVDNVVVHLAYVANDFRSLLDTDIYLPEHWADDLPGRREAHISDDIEFRTKPRIAQDQIRRALGNGIRAASVTFDELYGRDSKFLDFLDEQQLGFVGENPGNFHGWILPPQVLTEASPNAKKGCGRK
jgi:SRSO17 transposase